MKTYKHLSMKDLFFLFLHDEKGKLNYTTACINGLLK